MSDQIPKTISKEQLEETIRLTERQIEEKNLELAKNKRKMEEVNEKLTEAKDELKFFKSASIDINKLTFETMKHLTTLSAGSIVLMVTFQIHYLGRVESGWVLSEWP